MSQKSKYIDTSSDEFVDDQFHLDNFEKEDFNTENFNEEDFDEEDFDEENFDEENFDLEEENIINEHAPLEADDIALRSNEVKEVLGAAPSWIIRSGILMVAIVVFLFLLGSYFFKYPDIVTTQININTEILPASIIAKQSGKIVHMVISENQQVTQGEHLAVIENTASYDDVLLVDDWFQNFYRSLINENKIDSLQPYHQGLQLGNMQQSFFELQSAINKYYFHQDQASVEKKIAQLQLKITSQQEIIKGLKYRNSLKKKSFALAKKKYRIDKRLFKKKVITEQEFDEASNTYLSARLQLNQISEEETNQQLTLDELKYQILELSDQGEETFVQLDQMVRSTAIAFKEALKVWHEQYVLVAPIAGKVSFYKFWSEIQEVSSGDEVMVILPDTDAIFAYSYLPADNSGKVAEGQKVRIELQDFPYQQYGSVFGTIASKSEISREGKYFVKINLPDGLVTDSGHSLKFSQEMSGNAYITTKELRLLERLFYSYTNDIKKMM